jgi:hypothetical protein
VEVRESPAALREVEHVARAVDIHADADVAFHAQVVDRGEVPDFGDVVGRKINRRRDVAFDDANAIAEVLGALAGEGCELWLHETDGIRVRVAA